MKKLTTYLIFLTFFLLNGCSWNELFVVKNNSDKPISVSYQIEPSNSKGIAIFDDSPTIYSLKKRGNINWEKLLTVSDNDTSQFTLNISLPPKSALIFGRLSNDQYKNHKQCFINDRYFNFVMMEIKKEGKSISILKNQFDNFFKKVKGEITYEIK